MFTRSRTRSLAGSSDKSRPRFCPLFTRPNCKEKALPLLEKAYGERGIQFGGNTCSLKIDKRLDALHGDPRFERLLAKFMGETK